MLYKNIEFGVDCDSRIALVGPNGAGGCAVQGFRVQVLSVGVYAVQQPHDATPMSGPHLDAARWREDQAHSYKSRKHPSRGSWLLGLGKAAISQDPASFQPRNAGSLLVG